MSIRTRLAGLIQMFLRGTPKAAPKPAKKADPEPRRFPGQPNGASRLYSVRSDEVIQRLASAHPQIAARTIAAAERILKHEFDLLGSGPFTPRDPDRAAKESGYLPIDWALDPVKNLRFRNDVPYREWKLYEMRPGLADIKHPWELARCQHFAVLTQAYRFTRRLEFATEVLDEIADFTEACPEGRGIQWTCTMDVALRAASFALALEDLRCAGFEHPGMTRAYEALFDHGHFIFENLENHYEVTSNHFLSNVVGLHFIAVVFEGSATAKTWSEFCRLSLEREIDLQILPDGADYESSVPYHRLVAELFLAGARLAECEGKPLSASFQKRLTSAIDFLAGCLRPDGLMPVIGDADDGRVHIFSGYGSDDPRDPRHLFGPAAAMLGRPDWRRHAGPSEVWEAAFWGYDVGEPVTPPSDTPSSARLFPDAGLAVLSTSNAWLIVSNGETGTKGFGNHKHNDLLSFEFHAEGGPWIVDPGSYVYTGDPDARNLHRSTAFHSTLQLGDLEQGEMRAEWLFRVLSLSQPEHLECGSATGVLKYRGLHRGYARSAPDAVHTRSFALHEDRGQLIIDDRISGAFAGPVAFSFHLDPTVTAEVSQPGLVRLRRGTTSRTLRCREGLECRLEPAFVSPSYGRRAPSTLVRFFGRVSGEGEPAFQFTLEPADRTAA